MKLPVIVQTSDRVALRAPVWRELGVSQLVEKSDFIHWLDTQIASRIGESRVVG
jgi:hypothetical protein